MVKFINKSLILSAIFTLLLFSNKIYAASSIVDVAIDGNYLQVENMDHPPIVKNNRTLIPIRAITENLGATVGWNPTNKKITIQLNNTTIEMFINQTNVKVNGVSMTIDVAPTITEADRTIVPLRFINESLGYPVYWSQKNRAAHIFTSGQSTNQIQGILENNRYIGLNHSQYSLPSYMESLGGMMFEYNNYSSYGLERLKIFGQEVWFLNEFLAYDNLGNPQWQVKDVVAIPNYNNAQAFGDKVFQNSIKVSNAVGLYQYQNQEYFTNVYGAWYLDTQTVKLKQMPLTGVTVLNEMYE